MYSNTRLRFLILCTAVLFHPSSAMAELITFGFTGVVTTVDPELASEFSVGESLVGSYTFESTTLDVYSSNAMGIYDYAITEFNATFGGDYTITLGSFNDISVTNGPPSNDAYSMAVTDPIGPSVAGIPPRQFFFHLLDLSSTVFDSDLLPLTPPDLSDFNFAFYNLTFLSAEDDTSLVTYHLTSLTLIPEPTTFSLSLAAVLSVFRRRRSYCQLHIATF